MKLGELTVEIKITNKDKLNAITKNIIKLAELAKDNPGQGRICNDIIKCFKDLYEPEHVRNKCTGCLDRLEGIFEEMLLEKKNTTCSVGIYKALNKLRKLRSQEMNIIE